MTDGMKMFLGIGLLIVIVGVGLVGANRAKNSMEESGSNIENTGNEIIEGLDWTS